MNDLDVMADSAAKTADEMNLLYSPSRWCRRMSPDLVVDHHFELGSAVSEKTRQSLRCELNVSYGSSEREKYDVITSDNTPQDAPVLVYFHGGYWHIGSKDYGSFLAEIAVESRAVLVNVGYDLCPHVSMTDIVYQARRALDHVQQMALRRGSSGIYVVGHSAGAQLATMALRLSQSNSHLVKGLFLLSGVFDLRPLLETSHNVVLKMTQYEAWSLSPLNADTVAALHQKYPHIQVVVVSAEFDSPAFKQQACALFEALKSAGQNVQLEIIAGVDHFDLIERLSAPDYSLTQLMTTIIGGKNL